MPPAWAGSQGDRWAQEEQLWLCDCVLCGVRVTTTTSVPSSVSLLALSKDGKSLSATSREGGTAGESGSSWLSSGALLGQDGMSSIPFSRPGHIQGMQLCPGENPTHRGCAEQGEAVEHNPRVCKVLKAQNPLKTPPNPRWELHMKPHRGFFCIQLKIFIFFPLFSAQLLISAG